MNKVILVGNLARDPELKYTAAGKAFTSCSVAVNERWKAADGTKREKVTFVNFTIWGKRAEAFQKWTQKGSKVLLEGKLQIDKVEKRDGTGGNAYFTSVNVSDFEFLSKSNGPSNDGASLPQATAGAAAAGFAPPGTAALPSNPPVAEAEPWPSPVEDSLPATAALPGDPPAAAPSPDAPAPEPVAAAPVIDVPEEDLPW